MQALPLLTKIKVPSKLKANSAATNFKLKYTSSKPTSMPDYREQIRNDAVYVSHSNLGAALEAELKTNAVPFTSELD